MGEGNGKTIIAIVIVLVLLGAAYLWYTGGLGRTPSGGGGGYQGISTAGGGVAGGTTSSGFDFGGLGMLPLLGLGGGGLAIAGSAYSKSKWGTIWWWKRKRGILKITAKPSKLSFHNDTASTEITVRIKRKKFEETPVALTISKKNQEVREAHLFKAAGQPGAETIEVTPEKSEAKALLKVTGSENSQVTVCAKLKTEESGDEIKECITLEKSAPPESANLKIDVYNIGEPQPLKLKEVLDPSSIRLFLPASLQPNLKEVLDPLEKIPVVKGGTGWLKQKNAELKKIFFGYEPSYITEVNKEKGIRIQVWLVDDMGQTIKDGCHVKVDSFFGFEQGNFLHKTLDKTEITGEGVWVYETKQIPYFYQVHAKYRGKRFKRVILTQTPYTTEAAVKEAQETAESIREIEQGVGTELGSLDGARKLLEGTEQKIINAMRVPASSGTPNDLKIIKHRLKAANEQIEKLGKIEAVAHSRDLLIKGTTTYAIAGEVVDLWVQFGEDVLPARKIIVERDGKEIATKTVVGEKIPLEIEKGKQTFTFEIPAVDKKTKGEITGVTAKELFTKKILELAVTVNINGRKKTSKDQKPATYHIKEGDAVELAAEITPKELAAKKPLTLELLKEDKAIGRNYDLGFKTTVSGPSTYGVKVWYAGEVAAKKEIRFLEKETAKPEIEVTEGKEKAAEEGGIQPLVKGDLLKKPGGERIKKGTGGVGVVQESLLEHKEKVKKTGEPPPPKPAKPFLTRIIGKFTTPATGKLRERANKADKIIKSIKKALYDKDKTAKFEESLGQAKSLIAAAESAQDIGDKKNYLTYLNNAEKKLSELEGQIKKFGKLTVKFEPMCHKRDGRYFAQVDAETKTGEIPVNMDVLIGEEGERFLSRDDFQVGIGKGWGGARWTVPVTSGHSFSLPIDKGTKRYFLETKGVDFQSIKISGCTLKELVEKKIGAFAFILHKKGKISDLLAEASTKERVTYAGKAGEKAGYSIQTKGLEHYTIRLMKDLKPIDEQKIDEQSYPATVLNGEITVEGTATYDALLLDSHENLATIRTIEVTASETGVPIKGVLKKESAQKGVPEKISDELRIEPDTKFPFKVNLKTTVKPLEKTGENEYKLVNKETVFFHVEIPKKHAKIAEAKSTLQVKNLSGTSRKYTLPYYEEGMVFKNRYLYSWLPAGEPPKGDIITLQKGKNKVTISIGEFERQIIIVGDWQEQKKEEETITIEEKDLAGTGFKIEVAPGNNPFKSLKEKEKGVYESNTDKIILRIIALDKKTQKKTITLSVGGSKPKERGFPPDGIKAVRFAIGKGRTKIAVTVGDYPKEITIERT